MKKIFILSIVMVFSSCTVMKNKRQPAKNLNDIMISYYKQNNYFTENENIKRSGLEKDFDRAFSTWLPRLYPQGNVQTGVAAMNSYCQNYLYQAPGSQPYSTVNWTPLGPFVADNTNSQTNGMGQIHRITFDPQYNNTTNRTIYAASAFSGLWKSVDNGDSWNVLNTDLQLPVASVSDVAVDFNNSDNIFISTGYGDGSLELISNPNWGFVNPIVTSGIYRSVNGGLNWAPINNGFMSFSPTPRTTRRIIINPQNSNQLFVATSEGIFRTNDALAQYPTWQRMTSGLDLSDMAYRGLEFKPGTPTTVYASGKDIYRSEDGGNTWKSITANSNPKITQLPDCRVNTINLAVTPADPSRLYAYIEGTYICPTIPSCSAGQIAIIYMFKNETWTMLHKQDCHMVDPLSGNHYSDGINQLSPSWMGFAASPVDANQLFFGYTKVKGCRNVSDPGKDWDEESSYNYYSYHADCHALAFQPYVPDNPMLYAGTHGGVNAKNLLENASIKNWEEKYNGLNISMVWGFDLSKMYKDILISGYQCNGTKIRFMNNGNLVWKDVGLADGYGARIGYESDRIAFFSTNKMLQRLSFTSQNQPHAIFETDVYIPADPVLNDTVPAMSLLPNTFQIHKHISETNPIFGLTELYERKMKVPGGSGATLWEQESDIYKVVQPSWKRQITEFAIAPSDKNYIYIVVGGQIHPTYGIVPPQLYCSETGLNYGTFGSQPKFSDLTPYLPVIPGNTTIFHPIITGIAVHPADPKKIWLCFTGYYADLKVYSSSNGGLNWVNEDPNGNLANLPVNGIVYQEGTNDRLFIATDAGVYVKNSAGSPWTRYGNIPNVRVTELKINPCTGKLVASTFGRGIWETDLLPSNNVYQEIKANETWSNERILQNSIKIKAPFTLRITNTVYMPKDSRIIVEPGAELIIDGGRITQNCGFLWKGIELWRNSYIPQNPLAKQGKIEITGGGVIENAEIGILAGKSLGNNAGYDPAFGGGIIQCTNASFNNNKVAVYFTPHNGYSHSYFHNTTFLTSGALNDGALPDCFVKAYGYSEIRFLGCSFKNTSAWNAMPAPDRGTGIYSFNSRIFVHEGCKNQTVPCNSTIRGSFDRLSKGVYAINSGSVTFAKIKNTDFYDNLKGIYFSGSAGIANSAIVSCNFRVVRPGENIVDSYGVYLDQCSGYQVEENVFYSTGIPSDGTGLIVNNSVVNNPADINRIYRNTFRNLAYATIAQNTNRNALTGEGLCYKCNKFSNNYSDITVTSTPGLSVIHSFGIAVNQGAGLQIPSAPAGNVFDYNAKAPHWDLDNGLLNINYYYHSGTLPNQTRLRPDFRNGLINATGVNVPYSDATACPSSQAGTVGIEEIKDEIADAEIMTEKISIILSTLEDGESTGLQPEKTINRRKEMLMSQRDYWKSERSRNYLELIRHYRYDTIYGFKYDSLIHLLASNKSIESTYDLTSLYFQRGEYKEGFEILRQATNLIPLDDNQKLVHQAYVKFFHVLESVSIDRNDVLYIYEADRKTLFDLADSEQGLVSAFARNLLIASGIQNYMEPVILPKKQFQKSEYYHQ
ncbi:MAG: hypothetical protein Q8M08_14310 [Bacteroidales bacterium]|nr:hypothetical protein [Bacteroidales bacterium]